MVIHENIHATSDIVQQSPDYAVKLFKKTTDDFVNFLANDVAWAVGNNLKSVRHAAEQQIKVLFDKLMAAALALPAYGQVVFQVRVVDPALQKIGASPVSTKHFNVAALLDQLTELLKNLLGQGLTHVSESVKKSPFWDGKRKAA